MKLPAAAKKVFEGVLFDVYQWDQEMFDGSTEVFEAVKRKDTVTIIALQDGQVLLNHEEQPHIGSFIGFPGGVIDPGEEPLAAAKRELLEEAGLESSDWVHLKDFTYGSKTAWINHFFIAHDCRKVAEQKLDVGERIENRLHSFDEFLRIASSEEFRNKEFSTFILRCRLDEEKMASFKALLFSR